MTDFPHRIVVDPVTPKGVADARLRAFQDRARNDMRLLTSVDFRERMSGDIDVPEPFVYGALQPVQPPAPWTNLMELYGPIYSVETGAWGCVFGMLLVVDDRQTEDLVLAYHQRDDALEESTPTVGSA